MTQTEHPQQHQQANFIPVGLRLLPEPLYHKHKPELVSLGVRLSRGHFGGGGESKMAAEQSLFVLLIV